MSKYRLWIILLAAALIPVVASPSLAQQESAPEDPAEQEPASEAEEGGSAASDSAAEDQDEEELTSFFATTTVTATGTRESTFDIPTSVTVISEEEINRKLPNNAADLLRYEPGVDVNGVGPNQTRPIIRGQRGLRVLFTEDGLRMNNARRQTDFGEIPGLVDMESVEAMEVVRGPASVLYGTDAIGGVLNLVTKSPPYRDGSWVGGSFAARYGSAGEQGRGQLTVDGRQNRVSFSLGATYRDANNYEAASGSFGDVTLASETEVVDTGIRDDSIFGFFGYDLSDSQQLSLRFNRYRAGQAGFGFVEPTELGELDRIRIVYPFQDFDRLTMGYNASALQTALANTVNLRLMYQRNKRELVNEIDVYASETDFGPLPPGLFFHVAVGTENFTDLETWGFRGEVTKILGGSHLLTYGADYYDDDSFNTDFSATSGRLAQQFAPGTTPVDITPPFFDVEDDVANTPNATNTNWGIFVQDEFLPTERLRAIVGVRYANSETRAKSTPGLETAGLDSKDDAVVGAVNLIYGVSDNLKLVGTYGTAFRAPNIVERLFNGPTPEGSGYQILNLDLTSETSENFDLGLKYQRRNAFLELVYFRNEIDDGIIQNFLSEDQIAALPPDVQEDIERAGASFVVQQVNADRLRYEGVETSVGYRSVRGLSVGGNYTYLDAKRIDSTNPPTGDTVTDKVNAWLRYQPVSGRYWVEYRLRYNGSEDANIDPDEPAPPIGSVIPSFTVHQVSGGVTLGLDQPVRHYLGLLVDNLTDELYSEFSNATFFRPQPKRNYSVTYRLMF